MQELYFISDAGNPETPYKAFGTFVINMKFKSSDTRVKKSCSFLTNNDCALCGKNYFRFL